MTKDLKTVIRQKEYLGAFFKRVLSWALIFHQNCSKPHLKHMGPWARGKGTKRKKGEIGKP